MLQKVFRLSEKGSKELRGAVFACILSNLVLLMPFSVVIQFINVFVESSINGIPVDIRKLWILFVAAIAIAVIYFFVYLNEYDKTYTVSYRESANTRIEIAEKLRQLPLSFFNRKDLSELTNNIMGDCTTIEHTISHVVPTLLATIVTISIACIFLAFYNWKMALSIFCIMPVSFLIIFLSKKLQTYLGEKHISAKLEVSKQMQEYLEGIKVVKAFGLSGEKSQKLKASLLDMKKKAIQFELITAVFITLAQLLLRIGTGLVVLIGVKEFTAGRLTTIEFIFFMMVSARIYAPVQSILTLLPELFYMQNSTKRLQILRDEPIMTGSSNWDPDNHHIMIANISFAYNTGETVIDKVSIELPEGSVTALVGPSGSGKSTISRLIARFWDVDSGDISIGGKDIKTIEPERLMGEMSFVFQDVILFNDTVMNNIRMGNTNTTDEEVIEISKAARCHDFIMDLPDGYQSIVGENGCTVSGGERQRISIARALLKNAPIILLDEATASLDPENEVLIQEALNELIRDKTVIVIAHRLKTIANADNIIVLNEGKIVEQGDSATLLENDDLYAKLFRIQTNSHGWSTQS